ARAAPGCAPVGRRVHARTLRAAASAVAGGARWGAVRAGRRAAGRGRTASAGRPAGGRVLAGHASAPGDRAGPGGQSAHAAAGRARRAVDAGAPAAVGGREQVRGGGRACVGRGGAHRRRRGDDRGRSHRGRRGRRGGAGPPHRPRGVVRRARAARRTRACGGRMSAVGALRRAVAAEAVALGGPRSFVFRLTLPLGVLLPVLITLVVAAVAESLNSRDGLLGVTAVNTTNSVYWLLWSGVTVCAVSAAYRQAESEAGPVAETRRYAEPRLLTGMIARWIVIGGPGAISLGVAALLTM